MIIASKIVRAIIDADINIFITFIQLSIIAIINVNIHIIIVILYAKSLSFVDKLS